MPFKKKNKRGKFLYMLNCVDASSPPRNSKEFRGKAEVWQFLPILKGIFLNFAVFFSSLGISGVKKPVRLATSLPQVYQDIQIDNGGRKGRGRAPVFVESWGCPQGGPTTLKSYLNLIWKLQSKDYPIHGLIRTLQRSKEGVIHRNSRPKR